MKYRLLVISFKLLALLPLKVLRLLGSCTGLYKFYFAKRANQRIRHNLLLTGIAKQDTLDGITKECFKQFDRTIIEAACIAWSGASAEYMHKLVVASTGVEDLKGALLNDNAPVIILFPHLSNIEIAAHCMQCMFRDAAKETNRKVSILYKPLKSQLINRYILDGRGSYINYVPTTRAGIMDLLKQLKSNGIIAISPDHVASEGDGIWVDFFGHKVFATTLSAKLINYVRSNVFFLFPKSVPGGFEIDYVRYIPTTTDVNSIVQDIYVKLEQRVRLYPSQYYWNYEIFRAPKHAPNMNNND